MRCLQSGNFKRSSPRRPSINALLPCHTGEVKVPAMRLRTCIYYMVKSGSMYRMYSSKVSGKSKRVLSGWSSDWSYLRNTYGLG